MKTLRVTRLGAVALLCCAQIASAMAITFTHDAFINFADVSNDGQDIVVTNCTLTVDGSHTFNSLQVLNGGVMTHSALPYGPQQFVSPVFDESHVISAANPATLNNTNVDTGSITVMDHSETILYTENADYIVTVSNQFIQLTLTTNSAIGEGSTVLVNYSWTQEFQGFILAINNDAMIATGGAINVSGKGYAGGIGANSGAGTSRATNSPFTFTAGGGGGHGGAGGMSSTLARGGATYDSTTNPAVLGSGGGAGSSDGGGGGGVATLFVGGNFQIDGQLLAAGLRGTNAHSGGGAGGSILVSAASISGAGTISANGGNGDTPDGGGGGGGRIAVYSGTNNFTGNISAFGGGGSTAGGAGTIYLQSNTNQAGQLFIVNGGKLGTNTTFSAAVSDLTISGGAILQAPILPLSVTNLFLGSNSWLMSQDSIPLTVMVSGNATVETNAIINADFKSSNGSGAGSASCGAGSGGSYGGYGGVAGCGTGAAAVYGSVSQPSALGSPGASGNRGGGAIKMTVAGTLSLDGKISANGASAVAATTGSGSGGSVWLTVGTFAGTGAISGNGGSSSNFVSGGGGGGRVAVYFNTNVFTGDITAQGGTGISSGGPGSVYLKSSSSPISQMTFDNGGLAGATLLQSIGEFSDLTISGGAVVTNAQTAGIFLRSLFIGSNSWFTTLPTQSGQFTGLSGTITNVTIQNGGGITTDGKSSSAGLGLGQGSTFGGGGGGGAGFGGAGASNALGGTAIVTSPSSPSTGGGMGGNGSGLSPNLGGLGGGVISLNIPGILALDGRISANGTTSSSLNSGGGGGGSVHISARTISGGGSISANGGAGNNFGGGGSGGAIALSTDTNLFSGPITAVGGSGANYGGAGMMYFGPFTALNRLQPTQLILDNGGNRGARTPLGILSDVSDLTITGGATASNAVVSISQIRNLLVGSNSVLQVFSTATPGAPVNVSSNVTILAGGSLNVDGLASSGSSPGQSLNSTGGGGGNAGTGGASALGGAGGSAISDSLSTPISVGSRGGFGLNQLGGGNGGGTLRLEVSGTLLVNGRISADGVMSTNFNSGGGAGGSVSLSTKAFAGNGVISASGGAGNAQGGGGGGGHIAISYTTNTFTGSLAARGGSGANFGGAGTIYLTGSSPFGIGPATTQLILDNGGVQGGFTPLPNPLQGNFSLTITGGAFLTNAFISQLQSLFIGSNSTWFVASTSLFNLTVLTNAVIQSGGILGADGISSTGPSPGQSLANKGGGGGGHGGYGGASLSNAPGGNVTSDSITSPASIGSGGGSSGGFGGGALEISVRGALQLDGKLSVNGVMSSTSINSGGGSGGSIWLTTGKLSGIGSISANGGAGNNQGGGGGGGRIAVWCNTNLFAGAMTARGGAGANYGGAGTVFVNPNTSDIRPTAQLILDNGGVRGTNTGVLSTFGLVNVVITNGASMGLGLNSAGTTWNNLTISSNSSLTLAVTSGSMHLQINSNFDLQTGGTLTLDGEGFGVNSGGGPGRAGVGSSGGAGHGGYGSAGNTANAAGGAVFDSITNPNAPGSGGGSIAQSGSVGGGVAQLTVNGICKINGVISANGTAGMISGAGGASGGSIWLTAGTISGSGKITADGGNGDVFTSGGGGGGRIAVYVNTNLFTGTLSARGGAGVGLAGGAGTIYWKTNLPNANLPGEVIVDNGGSAGTNTPMFALNPPVALSIRNHGIVASTLSLTLQNLSIDSDSSFVANNSSTLNLTVLGDVLIATNGAVIADQAGYNPGFVGPGTGTVDFDGEGGGGGYGGAGGASYFGAAGGSTYGSSNQPVDLGAPGGISPILTGFSQGGGAIRMTVNGSLTVNGSISADGADGFIDGSGGGAGGSIWLTAQKLLGNGSITANGGQGESFEGGGGGGGRIAIYLGSNSFAGNVSAMGGNGTSSGQNGTIYIPTSLLISGNVTNSIGAAIAGVTLQPSGLASVISDNNGYYSVNVPLFWTGSVTPSGNGIIVPSVRTYSKLSLDAPVQNFVLATPSAFNLNAGQFDGTYVSFNWQGMNGVHYQLESSSNLVDWASYGPPFIGANAPLTLFVPPTNAPQMYFRLSVSY